MITIFVKMINFNLHLHHISSPVLQDKQQIMWKCVMITQGNCSTVKCWLTNEKMYLMNIKINTDVDIIFWYHICQTTTVDAINATSTDP